jgi:hypothetical protein
MEMNANRRHPKPSELQRPSIACREDCYPKRSRLQKSETIDTRCVNVTRNAKAASEDGLAHGQATPQCCRSSQVAIDKVL